MSNTGNDCSTADERTDNEASKIDAPKDTIKRTKRKKASRACFHCQKAHLTCDDSRPCQRCIKRGLDSTCQDGIRKKAKYLQDVEPPEQGIQKDKPLSSTTSKPAEVSIAAPLSSMPQLAELPSSNGTVSLASVSQPLRKSIYTDNFGVFGDNLLFDYPPLSTYDFDSKAANMEYSMLSNMLGNAGTPGTEYGHSPDPYTFSSPSMNNLQQNMPNRQQTITPDQASVASEASWSQLQLSAPPSQKGQLFPSNGSAHKPNSAQFAGHGSLQTVSPQILGHFKPTTTSPLLANTSNIQGSSKTAIAQAHVDPHGQRPTPVARRPPTISGTESDSIYKSITKPFSYTNGYHLLNTYLKTRFGKEDILRIARAIVGYRPSFIALTKTLREEDLVFMEVCFQRTLLEYEKFVGYSGTPTIIWRRTGQIELVGKEFCLLTKWSREQLLSKQTFIVELMDDSSVVEYFEKFSAHAFGDTSSVQTTCVLMTPQKRAVPCAFCFTIKRDVFDIPTMIVGNFLPVL